MKYALPNACASLLLAVTLQACSKTEDHWGESCISEYQGRFDYDANAPEASCVEVINKYRSEMGQAPLTRWTDGELCARNEAEEDATTNTAHGAFGTCGEMAQNSCPGWGSVDAVLGGCLLDMYCEGPSSSGKWDTDHGHHMNMVNSGYSQVACGFHQMSDGQYWVNINFK
ncbi:MAG: hypothetical protein QM784_11490 [Polyangiaceae bacterium]